MWVAGFFIGFVLSSPFGPIGLICLRRTLAQGSTLGLISASGISLAYAFWAYAVIHGLTRISLWIEQEKTLLEGGIGLFFLLYGLHGTLNTPATDYPTLRRAGKTTHFFSTFLVAFLNPGTCIMFAVLFTLFGMASGHHSLADSLETAFAVFFGSFAFWFLLSRVLNRIRVRLDDRAFLAITRMSSLLVTAFGLFILGWTLWDIIPGALKATVGLSSHGRKLIL